MLKKSSTPLLLVMLVVLIIVLAIIKLTGVQQKSERNFRSELVDIDTAKVTAIHIFPKSKPGEEVVIHKDNTGNWKVDLKDGKTAPVDSKQIKSILEQLLKIKPKRLAAKSQDKWEEFQVTDKATRVQVDEGDKTTLDLIIGKFSYQKETRAMTSFVRLQGDDDIYAVDGFLGMTFNRGIDDWRDKKIIKDDQANWTKLSYREPVTGTYSLEKKDNRWMINGNTATDSLKTLNFLKTLSNTNAQEFEDGFDPGNRQPDYTLTITTTSGTIDVTAYAADSAKTIVHSSQNPDAWFNGEKGDLIKRIFVGKEKFLPGNNTAKPSTMKSS